MISITIFFIGCRAQFQENRSIFNTPNPRLMNVSLLKESKSQGQGQGVSRNASTRKSTIKARNASKSIRRSIYDAEVDKHRVSLLCATAGVSIIGSVHFVNVVFLLSVVLEVHANLPARQHLWPLCVSCYLLPFLCVFRNFRLSLRQLFLKRAPENQTWFVFSSLLLHIHLHNILWHAHHLHYFLNTHLLRNLKNVHTFQPTIFISH